MPSSIKDHRKLRVMRLALGLNQQALADHLGVSQPKVANMENGKAEVANCYWKKMKELDPNLPRIVDELWSDLAN